MVENLAVDATPSRALRALAAIAALALATMAVATMAGAFETTSPAPRCPAAGLESVAGPELRPTLQTRYRGLNPRYLQRELHGR
jgi:hypothetical protein